MLCVYRMPISGRQVGARSLPLNATMITAVAIGRLSDLIYKRQDTPHNMIKTIPALTRLCQAT